MEMSRATARRSAGNPLSVVTQFCRGPEEAAKGERPADLCHGVVVPCGGSARRPPTARLYRDRVMEDGATEQGSVTAVLRIGGTVRRPRRRWTPAVHALLEHLETVGFTGAPKVMGVDREGREILSFLSGDVAMTPWPGVLLSAAGIEAVGTWLRDYHAAVRHFRPPDDARWYAPDAVWRPGLVVRHGDLGMWNSVWQDGGLIGFIDWDFIEPGEAVDDLAQLAWYAVPLRADEVAGRCGFTGVAPRAERLRLLCAAYGGGFTPSDVLAALRRLQLREAARVREHGAAGLAPWDAFLRRGDAEEIDAERAWLDLNGRALAGC